MRYNVIKDRKIVTTLAATMVAVMILVFSAIPAFADFTTVSLGTKSQSGNALLLSVTATGNIPRFPSDFPSGFFSSSVLVFGYAWVHVTDGTATGVVAAIHPGFTDSNQNPNAWHTHPVSLSAGTGTSTFCISSIGTSQGGITIQGSTMNLNIPATQAGVSASDLNTVASFIVHPDSGCTATGLGVVVLSGTSL